MPEAITFKEQVASGERFEFGKNWQSFLSVLDDDRIREAERSLREMLGVENLDGRRLLDVGCGSGLFSLAAQRLGAAHVHSFDFDPQSVACAQSLHRTYVPQATNWTIERGSVLDQEYLRRLGQWDIVYSWGVLHHTGAMWQALANVEPLVAPGGLLFIAIYNDQGLPTRWWKRVKRLYNAGPLGKAVVCSVYFPYFGGTGLAADVIKGRNPLARYREYRRVRGMSKMHDWFDWLGGLPFEVAKPEQIFDFYRGRGFEMIKLKTCAGGLGCNEFVFQRLTENARHQHEP